MTKGTKIFRIIISVILGLTVLLSAFFASVFVLYIESEVMEADYRLIVADVYVTRNNQDDILGDGTVSYDPNNNVLTFNNAEITYDSTVIYSKIDLLIELVGENKFIMSGDYVPVIYASDYVLSKDLAFFGDGSLSIEFKDASADAMGIHAKDLRIETDITISMPDCSNIVNGIYCEGSLMITGGANVTVNHGAGKYSTAVKARDDINIETGSALNVSIRPGSTDICRGVNACGSLFVWDGGALNVSVDDAGATTSECINVSGVFSVGRNATVTAASKKVHAIECYGSIKLNEGASVSASTEGEGADILCYGAIVNYGATVNSELEALGGVHNK